MRWARLTALCLLVAGTVHAQPTVRGVGSVSAGAGAVSPGRPTGTCSGDLMIMACETAGTQTISATGWTAVPNGCDAVQTGGSSTTDTRLTLMYRVAATCSPSCTCTDATTTFDSGNHQICRIIGITTGTYNSSSPFDACTTNTQTSNTTSVSVSGATASESASLVLAFAAGAIDDVTGTTTFSSEANSNLASITERFDNGTDAGNGGLLGAWSGIKTHAGAWGATTATSASSTIWANISLNIRAAATYTPTATATSTPTATVTQTPTKTSTPTPTVASGCHRVSFTPAASADDVRLWSQDNAAAAMTTGETTIQFGVWTFLDLIDFEDVAALRFNTAPTIPDDATVTAAWLELYTIAANTVDVGGLREFVCEWTTGQGAWATSDWENELFPANACQFPYPADIGATNRYRTIQLDNPSNVDISGSYTGIKLGATNPSQPTASDSLIWDFQSVDGANPPILRVEYCDATPTGTATRTTTATGTRTHTPTATATGTATNTGVPTGTPTLLAGRDRCPDRNGDGLCGVLVLGSERTAGLFPWLTWVAPSADMLCDGTVAGQTSGQMRALVESGTEADTCTDLGGTVERGADLVPDVVLVDIGAVYDFVSSTTAPRVGRCFRSGDPCRVEAPLGFVDSWATDPHAKCIDGPDYRTPCLPKPYGTPTPCAGDPAPNDPVASWCQPWVFADGEAGVTVTACAEGMCQQRSHIHATYRNILRIVSALRARRQVPVLVFPWMPASWQSSVNTAPVRTTPAPDGTPYPDSPYQAMHEVAAADLRLLRGWLQAHRASDTDLAFIDLQRHFERETTGRAWRALGDQTNLATHAQAGRCTCQRDADCGAGGTCTSGVCTAGPRASCTADKDCRGSDSIQHPGSAWCARDMAGVAAVAVNACLEDLATSLQPEWESSGVLCCSDPCIPAPEGWVPWPTSTPTRTITQTPTVTATGTATHTATATPVESNTPGGSTPTPTYTIGLPPATIPSTSTCWKATNGKLADIYGAQMRRIITEWSTCMRSRGNLITSSVCDIAQGVSDYSHVPGDITWAMRMPNSLADSRGIGRVGFHAVEDKLKKFCTDDEILLFWAWVRYRAQELAQSIPSYVEPVDYGGANGTWPWFGWFNMIELQYMHTFLAMLRADISASTAVIDPECAGHVANEIGYRLFDDWITRGNAICHQAFSAGAVTINCGGFKPTQQEFELWCDAYYEYLMPVWQAARAVEGKACGTGCP